jgi:DNA polymerase III subunit delta'
MGFDSIVGHERQKKILLSLLEGEKLPQAFLFSGQEGIGKKRIALETVKHIFCERKTACGSCRACLNIEKGSHPDLFFVDRNSGRKGEDNKREDKDEIEDLSSDKGGGTIGIDLVRGNEQKGIRGINEEVYEYPFEAGKRAIVIDEAEFITTSAANALLKTLEEPPPYNIFFLITSSESAMPLTIRSRCVRIAFSPLSGEDLLSYFTKVFKGDEERARLFSHISYGSIGCGLFWVATEHYEARRRLAELIIGKNRSYTNVTMLSEHAVRGGDRSSMIYISFLLSLFRDLYVLGQVGDSSMVINRDIRDLLERESVDSQWIARSIERVQETFRAIRYNVNRWLLFESLLLQIMR